jgi:hypothetical protein
VGRGPAAMGQVGLFSREGSSYVRTCCWLLLLFILATHWSLSQRHFEYLKLLMG